MRDLHYSQRSMGRIDDPAWASVDCFREVSKRPESAFIEDVGNNHVSSNGEVRLVDLDVPGEDETPLSLAPVLVHPHVCSVWRAPSEIRRVLVHGSLQKDIRASAM